MGLSFRKNREFSENLYDPDLLEKAVAWISANLEVLDVFCEADLAAWAEANGYKKEGTQE